ncbi:MAG: hypothetical protein ABI166_10260 [Mucilaginibacter sp.]
MKKLIIQFKKFVLKAVAALSKTFRRKRRRQRLNIMEEILFV